MCSQFYFDNTNIISFSAISLQRTNYFSKNNYHQIFQLLDCWLIHLQKQKLVNQNNYKTSSSTICNIVLFNGFFCHFFFIQKFEERFVQCNLIAWKVFVLEFFKNFTSCFRLSLLLQKRNNLKSFLFLKFYKKSGLNQFYC